MRNEERITCLHLGVCGLKRTYILKCPRLYHSLKLLSAMSVPSFLNGPAAVSIDLTIESLLHVTETLALLHKHGNTKHKCNHNILVTHIIGYTIRLLVCGKHAEPPQVRGIAFQFLVLTNINTCLRTCWVLTVVSVLVGFKPMLRICGILTIVSVFLGL